MKKYLIIFLLFVSFSHAQEADTPCQYGNCEEVESEDPLPEASIEEYIPFMYLTAICMALFYFNTKKDDELR